MLKHQLGTASREFRTAGGRATREVRIGYALHADLPAHEAVPVPGFGRPDSPKGITEGITAEKAERHHE